MTGALLLLAVAIKSDQTFATISDISLQTLPGFLPLSVKRPRHYLASAVLIFNMEV